MKLIHFLIHEIKELASRAVYFLVCFALILVFLKLFLKDYSIDLYIFPKILLGALFAAKAVLLVDQMGMGKRRSQKPRYINVLSKTFFYTLIAVALVLLEAFIRGLVQTKAIPKAIEMAIHENFTSHFLAVILFVIIIFIVYNVIDEINLYLGGGNRLKKLFFDEPNQ